MGWSILFTTLALVIVVASLFMGWRITRNLRIVSAAMENVSIDDTKIARSLKEVSWRLETTRVTDNLESRRGCEVYLRSVQARAVDSKPQYLELREGERLLTPAGRQLLDSELTDEIERIAKENPKLPTNEFLLKLDIRFLYNKASEKDVSLDTMVAILASYIHEVQEGIVQCIF